jgi:hypothetical protein
MPSMQPAEDAAGEARVAAQPLDGGVLVGSDQAAVLPGERRGGAHDGRLGREGAEHRVAGDSQAGGRELKADVAVAFSDKHGGRMPRGLLM